MARLSDVAEAIKSANAGATWITFDIVLSDRQTYEHVHQSGALSAELLGHLYKVDPAQVEIYLCDAIRTIKVTIPRGTGGGVNETDFDGTQQFAPLLDIEVPDLVAS